MLAQIDGNNSDLIYKVKSTFVAYYIKVENNIETQSLENKLKIWISNETPHDYHVWCKDAKYQSIEEEKEKAEQILNDTSLICIVSKHCDLFGTRHLVFTGENHFKSLHNDYDLTKYLVNFANGYNL